MRDVFDTGVLIRSLISPTSYSAVAIERAIRLDTILMSAETSAEAVSVFRRVKFDRYARLSARMKFLQELLADAEKVSVQASISVCRDPKDNMFLELAVSGHADVLVSEDKDLLVLDPFQGIRVLTPAAFLEIA